jgi:hypothetical protein
MEHGQEALRLLIQGQLSVAGAPVAQVEPLQLYLVVQMALLADLAALLF